MPRPGPPKIAVSVRMSKSQIEALEADGRNLIATGVIEEDEMTAADGSINVSAVVRHALRKSIVGFPA